MAKFCEICGRGPVKGIRKSHSNRKTKKWLGINLQTKKINGKKVKICTACIKTLTKQLAK